MDNKLKELLYKVEEVCDYFYWHNRNLTRKQEHLILDLEDLLKEYRENEKI